MDIQESKAFQEKLDEILKDTESFVNATKQLNKAKESFYEYVEQVAALNHDFSKVSQKMAECVEYASKIFSDDFSNDVQTMREDVTTTMKLYSQKAEELKEQYYELLQTNQFSELQQDHSNILDSIDELFEFCRGIQVKQEEDSKKLDEIIELLKKKRFFYF